MRSKRILFIILFIDIILFISFIKYQPSVGPHGGTLKQADIYNIEMKNPYGNFYAYLLDKNLKSISNKGISCQVKFFLADNTNVEVILKPQGEDAFIAENPVQYESCRVTFNIAGKIVSAKFENDTPLVKQKK